MSYKEYKVDRADSERFFRAMGELFPEATTFFVEGCSISDNVEACYMHHEEEGKFLPPRGTAWPTPRMIRCTASQSLFEELELLAVNHAAHEMLDHLALYENNEPILIWTDAFCRGQIEIADDVPQDIVEKFLDSIRDV